MARIGTIGEQRVARICGALLACLLLAVSGVPDRCVAQEPSGASDGVRQIVLPTAFYTPETSVAIGALFARVWTPGADSVRESSVLANVTYTFRNQLVLSHLGHLQPRADRLVASELTAALSWPDRFYPVGNDAGSESYEEWTARRVEALLAVLARFGSGPLFAGPVATVGHYETLESEEDGLLASGSVPGARRHTLLGGGIRATWDSRGSSVWPRSGGFHQLTLTGHTSAAGAEFELGRIDADLRWYAGVGRGVVALRSRLAAAWGSVPFTQHTPIGGLGGGIRGIYETRYADRTAVLGVVEYRRPLAWRLGVVAFAGAGRVARSVGTLSAADLHVAGGAGLRFAVMPGSGLNVGVDVAAGAAGTQVYVNLGEAF